MPEFTVSQEQLDAWARSCGQANYHLLHAREHLARSEGDAAATAAAQLQPAVDALGRMLQTLIRAGAARPCQAPEGETSSAALPPHDTPAARRLLALLHEAEDVAGEVDRERNWTNGGWAEAIEKLAFPLSVEVQGTHPARTERP